MADVQLRIRADSGNAQQEIRSMRQEIQTLRTQLGQTGTTLDRTGDQIDNLGDEAKQASVGVTALGRSIFNTSAEAKRFDGVFRSADGRLREANGNFVKGREAVEGMGRSFGGASGGAQVFTRTLGGLGNVLGGLGIAVVSAGVVGFGRASVEAATRIEGLRNGLTALYGSAQTANSILADLEDLAELPGITFEGAVQGALRLQTVGREGDAALGVIREFGNAAALAGNSSEELGRAMVGLTQIISRGALSQEELNQILEAVPLIGVSIREAFGSIDAETIRNQLDSAGQGVNDFVDILVNQLATQARASADSTANAFSNLGNALFQLEGTVGDILLPVVRAGVRDLTNLFQTTRELIEGTDDLTLSFHAFSGEIENRTQIIQYVESLRDLRDAQQDIIDQGRWWQDTDQASENVAELNRFIRLYQDALSGVPGAEQALQAELENTSTALAAARSRYVQALSDVNNAEQSNARNAASLQAGAQERLATAKAEVEGLTSKSEILTRITGNLERFSEGQDRANQASTQAVPVYENLTRQIDTARDNVDRWTEALENAGSEAEATEAYDNLVEAYNTLFQVQSRDAQQRSDGTALYRAERDQVRGLTEAEKLRAQVVEESSGRIADARVEGATRAREAEVAGFEVAARTGGLYADVLSNIARVSQRQAFVSIVQRFQDQGLSLRAAILEATKYVEILDQRIPPAIEDASGSLRDFSIASQDAFQNSADSVVNLTGHIIELGGAIRDAAIEADQLERLDFSDVRADLNEQRYFQQNPIGTTIESDQQAAGEAGRRYVQQLERRIASFRGIERQIYNVNQALANQEITAAEAEERIDLLTDAFETFGHEGELSVNQIIGAFDTFADVLAEADGKIGDVGVGLQGLADLFTNPLDFAANTLGNVIVGLTEDFRGGPLGLPEGFFDDPVPGQAQVNPRNIRAAEDQEALQTHTAGIGRYLQTPGGLEFLRTNAPELLQRPGTREFIEQNFPELVDQAYPRGQGFNQSGALAGRDAARRTAERTGTDRQAIEDVARLQYGDVAYDAEVTAATAEEPPELTPAESIAPVIEQINNGIGLINASITSIETEIAQSNDPEEIAQLLSRIPALIREKYMMLRERLDAQYNAGVIGVDAYNASLSELESGESAEIEANSDAMLSNTLRIIDEDAGLINASITSIQTQIEASNDLAEIATLLDQIPALITEKYRLLREALDAKYAAGEISVDAYNSSLTAIDNSQARETEQHSDAVLANTLSGIDDDVGLINASISDLENRIAQSNDPEEISRLLMQIAEQIPEIYKLRRQALQAQYNAGEITVDALNAGLMNINTEESAALERNSDQQLANALLINQEAVNVISTEISGLQNRIAQSNDPMEIASLLQQIATQIPEIYRLKREALQKQFDAGEITKSALETGLSSLNIEESAALEQNSDQQLANVLLINQQATAAISTEISGLQNRIAQSNDPAEIASLLMMIATQIPEIYRLKREALQKQYDEGEITKSALDTGLLGLDTEESAALERNSDAQLTNALLINQQAQNSITAGISDLENRISQSNDPMEIASLLQQIATQIPEIYRLKREALQKQYDEGEITLEALNTGISQLNIEESAALERNSDQQLANTLLINQQAQTAISTEISDLENRISQSNDPEEISRLLMQIATQIPEIYRLRREALQKQYDEGEITLEALNTGISQLNIEESAALERNSDQQLANALQENSTDRQVVSNEITTLENQIRTSTDPQEIASLVSDLRTAIMEKYRLQREALQAQLEAEEISIAEFKAQTGALGIQETSALQGATQQGISAFSSLVDTAQFLLDNATEAEFSTRRQELIDAINRFYDERIAFINGLDLSDSDRENMREVVRISRRVALEAIPQMHESVTERLKLERDFQDEILDLRRDLHNSLIDLEIQLQRRLEDIQIDALRRREDIFNQAHFGRVNAGIGFTRGLEDFFLQQDLNISPDLFQEFRSRLVIGHQENRRDSIYPALLADDVVDDVIEITRVGTGFDDRQREQLERLLVSYGRGLEDVGSRQAESRIAATLREDRAIEDALLRYERGIEDRMRRFNPPEPVGLTAGVATLTEEIRALTTAVGGEPATSPIESDPIETSPIESDPIEADMQDDGITADTGSETWETHLETFGTELKAFGVLLETQTTLLETWGTHLETRGEHLETRGEHLETQTTLLETQTTHLETQGAHLETQGAHLETWGTFLETERILQEMGGVLQEQEATNLQGFEVAIDAFGETIITFESAGESLNNAAAELIVAAAALSACCSPSSSPSSPSPAADGVTIDANISNTIEFSDGATRAAGGNQARLETVRRSF